MTDQDDFHTKEYMAQLNVLVRKMLQPVAAPMPRKFAPSKRQPKAAHYVRFNDEAPHIGSGVRGVRVVKTGRKWTTVEEVSTRARQRLPRQLWDRIVAGELKFGPEVARVTVRVPRPGKRI